MRDSEIIFEALEFAVLAERFGEAERLMAEYSAAVEASASLEAALEARDKLELLRRLACAGRAHVAMRLMQVASAAGYCHPRHGAASALSLDA